MKPLKKPSAMGYALQQLYIPDSFVLDRYDEVFVANFFRDKVRASEAMLNALHYSEELIRRQLQCSS